MSQNEDTPQRDIALQRLAHAMRAVAVLPDNAKITAVMISGYIHGNITVQTPFDTFCKVCHPPRKLNYVSPGTGSEMHLRALIQGIEWTTIRHSFEGPGVSS